MGHTATLFTKSKCETSRGIQLLSTGKYSVTIYSNWHKPEKQTVIRRTGKLFYLGRYETLEEAQDIRKKACEARRKGRKEFIDCVNEIRAVFKGEKTVERMNGGFIRRTTKNNRDYFIPTRYVRSQNLGNKQYVFGTYET